MENMKVVKPGEELVAKVKDTTSEVPEVKVDSIGTFGEDMENNADLYNIFTPPNPTFDKNGKGVINLAGSATENEYLVVETREDGGFTILEHVIEKKKKATKTKDLPKD